MRREASLCGLAMQVVAEGDPHACLQFASALDPHLRKGSGFDGESFALDLRLLPGIQPTFDRLELSRAGRSFAVSGDGLAGEIGQTAGRLEVFGGGPAALQVAVRLACALWLAPRRGLLLHGASVEVDGRALVFLGPSGAGKTTLARRLGVAGARVIADEVAAVRMVGSEPRVFGHPLPRRLGDGRAPDAGLPLAAIGLLSHAGEGNGPGISRIAPAQAARAILQRVFLPAADSALIDGALACAEALSRTVPIYSLSLPNDDRAAGAALSLRKLGAMQ